MNWLTQIFYRVCTTCRPNKSATVRFAFPMAFVVVAALSVAAVITETESYVRLESSTANIKKGEIFWINVYAFAHTPVNAVDISLSFPQSKVEVTGIDTGESVLTLWTQKPYIENGAVILRGGTFRRGFVGEHLIATINMRGKATGVASFDTTGIKFLAGDGTGAEVEVENTNNPVNLYIYNQDTEIGGIAADASFEVITDIDGDGEVTLKDVSMFMSAWFGGKSLRFDFNHDGKVSFSDFSIILADSFFR